MYAVAKNALSAVTGKTAMEAGDTLYGLFSYAEAAPLFKAPKGEPDDLTVIKGIGPVAAKDLAEQGIVTFAQLAKLTEKDIAKIDEHMPFSADQIKDWREQAKELAKK